MKSINAFVVIFGIAFCMALVACSQTNNDNTDEETGIYQNNLFMPKELEHDIGARLDYPLIGIYFDDSASWVVLLEPAYQTDEEVGKYYICDDAQILSLNKEFFSIITVPAGRGTTMERIIKVFKDGILVESMEYDKHQVSSEELQKSFKEISSAEAKKINDKLSKS